MILSTTTAIYRDRPDGSRIPILDCVKKLHQAGFRNVDLNFCKMNQFELELTRDNWRDWIEEAKETMERLGMAAGQAHTPFYNVLDANFPNREHTEEMVRRSIIAAGELGVKAIVIHAGTHFFDCDYKKTLEDNIEYYKPHLELAGRYGMNIAVENLFDVIPAGANIRARRYTANPDEVIELVDALGQMYDNVGVCWDFGHANKMGWDQPQALKRIGNRLIALHVQDNYGVIDDHLFPYHGTVQWEPIMKTLKEINYQYLFAFETHKATMRVPDGMIDAILRYAFELGNYLLSLAG